MQDSSLEIKNSPNSTGKDIIILPAEEIKKYRDHYSKDDELKKLSENEKLVASQTVTLFGEGGNKRRKLDTIGQDLYSLTQHIIRQDKKAKADTTQIEKEEDLFPVPVQFYNNGQLFQASKIGDNIPSEVITSDLTEEQLKKMHFSFSVISLMNIILTKKLVKAGKLVTLCCFCMNHHALENPQFI